MAILVVVMMAATAFAPAMIALDDAVESTDAASSSAGAKNVSVKFFTSDTKSSSLSNLAYISDELPTDIDPTQWVRDDPANGGTGFWYNINKNSTFYGKILTYGDTEMYSDQIKDHIVDYFVDSDDQPIFTKTSYQFMQIEYTVTDVCNVNIQISKDGTLLKDANYSEAAAASGAQLGEKSQCVLYSIEKTKGDLRPTSERGDYDVVVKCEQKVTIYDQTVSYSEEDVTLYGIIYDNNANLPGGEVESTIITNATITYNILTTTGDVYKKDNTTVPITTAGTDYGKFAMTLPYGYIVEITDVDAQGYSFLVNGNTFTSQPVTEKRTDDIGQVIPSTEQRKSPIFTADQFSSVVNVKDSATLGLSNISLEAFWYYRVIETSGSVFYSENPDPTHIVAGTVDFVTNETDSDGNIILTYTEPQTSRTDVEMKLYVSAENTDAYSFSKDTLESGSSSRTEFQSLEQKGNIYLDLKHEISEVLRAEESSFVVTFVGKTSTTGTGGGAPLEGVEVNAVWLYDVPDTVKGGDWRKIYDSTSTIPISQAGIASAVGTYTDSEGQIIIAYRLPVVGAGGEDIKCYLYIYSDSGIFTMASRDPNDPDAPLVGSQEEELPALVSGYDGCKAIIKDDVGGTDVSLNCEEVTYTVRWTVTPAVAGEMPSYVDVSYTSKSWPTTESRTFKAYTENDKIIFDIVVREKDPFNLEILCSDYTIDPAERYVGSIMKDFKDSTYGSVAYKAISPTIPTATPGYLTDSTYTVSGLSKGDTVTFTYKVGNDQYSILVKAEYDGSGYKAVHSISGWDHQSIVEDSLAVSTTGNYYLGTFSDTYVIAAIKLVDVKLVTFYDELTSIPTIDNLVSNKTLAVYYNGNFYNNITVGASGTGVLTVPETGTLTYIYEDKEIVPISVTDEPYLGYKGFNFSGYIDIGTGITSVNVKVKYVASSSLENVEKATTTPIAVPDGDTKTIDIGDTVKFTAPSIEGFKFSGWVYNGNVITQGGSTDSCSITAESTMGSDITLYAVYGACSKTVTEQGTDNTVLAIGLVGIVVAILALVFILFQAKRY